MTRARELSKLANPSALTVDSNNNIGVNSTAPDAKLDVVGVVSATSFFGDGSSLTGIIAGATLSPGSGDQRVVVTSQTSGSMTAAATDAELTYNSGTNTLSATTFSGALTGNVTGNATGLSGTPDITVRNVVSAAATFSGNVSVAGTLTYEDVKNIDSVGVVTARLGIRVGGGQSIGSDGALTYYGDGSQLSGISAGISTGAASGGLVTLNLTNQDHKVTASGITTITVSGGTEGDSHTVRVVNSGVSTVGFSTYFLFPSGSTPSMPTASGTISILSFTVHRVGTAGTQLLAGAALNFS
tara:strand:+ start:132 stop:1028 length:897 start_codon:yes stop_codon:yes gene_type:complete